MPTLSSGFLLQNNYSRVMDRIFGSTQRAAGAVSRASGAVGAMNSRLAVSESPANRMTAALKKVGSALPGLEDVKKVMNLMDTYTNVSSRLSLITGSLSEQKALQGQIFAAANRSRGSYADMADTVAQLGTAAGGQFGNNDTIVRFTETMRKMFRLSGTSAAGQSDAFQQVRQALGSGTLQGQGLGALSDDAPMVKTAIAAHLGKSAGEVEALAAQGKITSGVLIDSILQYSGTVDRQIGQMKVTWGDYWNEIQNGAFKAFGSVLNSENSALDLKGIQAFIDGITNSFSALENVVNAVQAVLGFVEKANPLTLIILAIAAVIVIIYGVVDAVNQVTGAAISATGLIFGTVLVVASAIYNTVIGVINGLIQAVWSIFAEPFLGIVEWVLNVANGGFNGFGGAVANLIGQIIGWFLSLGEVVTKIIDAIFGTNWTAGLESLRGTVTAWGKNDNAITLTGEGNAPPTIGRWDPDSAWNTGYQFGQGIDQKVSSFFESTKTAPPPPPYTIKDEGEEGFGTSSNPATIQGTVNLSDQDMQYLRDLAEKQYVNKFSTAVLSPKLSVQFAGDPGNKEDQQRIYATMGRMLKEELAVASEGLYS